MRLAASWLVGSIFLTDHRTNRLPLYIPRAIETYPETNWDRYQDHSQVADIQHPLTWITLVQHWFQMTQLPSHLIHKYNISRLLSIKPPQLHLSCMKYFILFVFQPSMIILLLFLPSPTYLVHDSDMPHQRHCDVPLAAYTDHQ